MVAVNPVRNRMYTAEVSSAEEYPVSYNQYCIALRLWILPGGPKVVHRLIARENMIWGIKSFCQAAGLMKQYADGELRPEDCKGKILGVYVRWDVRWAWQVESFVALSNHQVIDGGKKPP